MTPQPTKTLISLGILISIPATVCAQTDLETKISEAVKKELEKQESSSPFELRIHGYGDIRFAHYDYAESETQSEESRGDSRVGFDLTRFTMELEGMHRDSGVEFEAEIEFEHGGTGSALELEQEEFGEFEQEVEKGGEVILEELYLAKNLGSGFGARAGRFYVAMGLLSDYHLPTDYLATGRAESESIMIPAVWDEIGLELSKQFSFGNARLQVVNGLDSTGFSAASWVSGGHQSKFESNRAEDLAFIGRFDYTDVPGLLLGASVYYGNTAGNRPKDDVDGDGTVRIADLHGRVTIAGVRAQAVVLHGKLDDAQEISERNSRLPNSLGVDRTAIGDEALAAWAEVGYNVAPMLGAAETHQIEPFVRYDYVDTYYDNRPELADNGRYERDIITAGLAYTYDQVIVTKLDFTTRSFGASEIDDQQMVRLGLGFVY